MTGRLYHPSSKESAGTPLGHNNSLLSEGGIDVKVVRTFMQPGAINPQCLVNAHMCSQCFIHSSAINWNALGYLWTRFFTPHSQPFSRAGVVIANVSFLGVQSTT